ncbi:MAG TPA: DUF2784 domain-containing protein [Gemmatimonadales bacterium]|nr:DUF2784 domain-containing protein [Gemmatimonadales bacterium]
MLYRALADAVVLGHALFVVFVVGGGALVWRWPRLAWAHVPCAVWGIAIEYGGWICPLTPLEVWLRGRAGLEGYTGSFVEHYVIPTLYPAGLLRSVQIVLGTLVLGLNAAVYVVLVRRALRAR